MRQIIKVKPDGWKRIRQTTADWKGLSVKGTLLKQLDAAAFKRFFS
jgi:hypothetical protein